jgi:uncharacterized lipoprotein YbaY
VKAAPLQFFVVLLVAALGLTSCNTVNPGPTPLPSVVCTLNCVSPTELEYGTVMEMRLVDFTQPDTRPQVLAERTESNPGQLPLHYRLLYNPAAIDPQHDYGVEARLLVKGRPIWVLPSPVPVITKGRPIVVELLLQPPSS